MDQELYQKLQKLAFERTIPFCYSCYEEAPSGTCVRCQSDDLMRLLPGVGCEYGVDWVIQEILSDELDAVDLDEAFEQSVRDCFPEESKVGWLTVNTVSAMKEIDSVSWRCAQCEWESQEESEGTIVSMDNGSTYYWSHEIEQL